MFKRALVLIIFLFIVVLVSGCGNLEQDQVEIDSKTEQEQENEFNVSGWKFYKNKELGFEISYPEDWKLYSEKEREIALNGPENEEIFEKKMNRQGYGEGYFFDIEISSFDSIYDLSKSNNSAHPIKANSIEELIKKDQLIHDENKIEISGKSPAWEAVIGGIQLNYVIFAENNNQVYKIRFDAHPKKALSEIEKQIISSFKFIE